MAATFGLALSPHARPAGPHIIQGFLVSDRCRDIRDAMNIGVSEPAEVLDDGTTLDASVRRATSIDVDSVTLHSVEAMLDASRLSLGAACQIPVESREGAAFLRYAPNGVYRRHRDRAGDPDWPGAARRLIAVVVFLNSSSSEPTSGEFSGGELVLFPELTQGTGAAGPRVIVPGQGMLVAFDASMPHEVLPVHQGTRDVIVDWYC
jgi:predicted 2-oxoglutarate/Fe(II)-dependent dioxygenase YbiX